MRAVLRLNPKECNLSCDYCLLRPFAVKESISGEVEPPAIKATLREIDSGFNISGGEPLLLPFGLLEELLRFGYENWGSSGLQTNGALLESRHVRLFKKYEVDVYISVDGPGKLNDFRHPPEQEKAKLNTKKSVESIERLKEEGIETHVGILITRANAATAEKLEELKDFLRWLGELGVASVQIKTLYVSPLLYTAGPEKVDEFRLAPRREKDVFLDLAEFSEENPSINVRFFNLCKGMLIGNNVSCCIFKSCDYGSTDYSNVVGPRGEVYNCIGSYRLANDPLKASEKHYQRYVDLYNTPREMGGCKGCRFFVSCLGLCPATARGDDPRNRSRYCELFKTLFEYYEEVLLNSGKLPVSKSDRREKIEARMIERLRNGTPVSINDFYQEGKG